MEVERLIFTTRRVRYFYARILAWMMYRIAYEYVTPEDVDKILRIAKETAKLTDAEVKALREMMEIIFGLVGREYIPTPSGLATIAEILPKARGMFDKVVQARRVPMEWVPIWHEYMMVRPVVDESKRILTSAERLFTRFVIAEDAFKAIVDTLRPFGYENHEIALIMRRVGLDRFYYAWDQLIGTPKELVALAEYSPKARSLALAQVDQMIEALPIDPATKEFLKGLWHEYVRIRPVYGEVRRYVTELIADYAEEVITMEELMTELEALKRWGLDDYEIAFYLMLAEKRKWRRLKRLGG